MAAQATDNVLQVRDQRADLSLRAAGAAAVAARRRADPIRRNEVHGLRHALGAQHLFFRFAHAHNTGLGFRLWGEGA